MHNGKEKMEQSFVCTFSDGDSFITLVKVGMRSEWTLSGKEAVLRARQSMELGDAFHAYIIDWRLPDMNGIEVTRQIRSLGDDTPIDPCVR